MRSMKFVMERNVKDLEGVPFKFEFEKSGKDLDGTQLLHLEKIFYFLKQGHKDNSRQLRLFLYA